VKLTAANHAVRASNVTASEVGALLSQHPYTTPGDIFDRIMGLRDREKEQTLAMEFGSRVEPILEDFAQRELNRHNILPEQLRLNAKTYQHRRVHLCATPDALILNSRELVEFKLSFSQNRWRDGLPPDIEWQARAQMACARRARVYVYVFTGIGKVYVVDRHHGKERLMTQAVERFWTDHILTGIRPTDPVIASDIVYRKASRP
jgi:predicted phage-related endonuclease